MHWEQDEIKSCASKLYLHYIRPAAMGNFQEPSVGVHTKDMPAFYTIIHLIIVQVVTRKAQENIRALQLFIHSSLIQPFIVHNKFKYP